MSMKHRETQNQTDINERLCYLRRTWQLTKNKLEKLWSFIYQNVGFGDNILSVADISQRYQSGNYQLQLNDI